MFFPWAATSIDFHKISKPRIRTRPWVPTSASAKSTNRGIYREVQSIHTPQPVRILETLRDSWSLIPCLCTPGIWASNLNHRWTIEKCFMIFNKNSGKRFIERGKTVLNWFYLMLFTCRLLGILDCLICLNSFLVILDVGLVPITLCDVGQQRKIYGFS